MKSTMRLLPLLMLLASCGPREQTSNVNEDPLLKHQCYAPTKQPQTWDKDAWVKRMIPAAQDAEKIHGVPAAAIVAMSSRESGYGLTKAFFGSNNPFGFKWNSSAQAEGKSYFVLECQPEEDGNNKYIKFANTWEATLFVAKKLATTDRYGWATTRYIQDRRNKMEIKQAVDRWIGGIADSGYNYDPPAYKQQIAKLVNNYQQPSTTRSNSYNLHWISNTIAPKSK